MPAISRATLLDHLRQLVLSLPEVIAAWEGGSAAFDYGDDWSDIDAVLIVEDAELEAVFCAIELGLQRLSPLALRHDVQGSVGYKQRFYRLRDCSEFLVVDLVLIRRSDPLQFRVVELHGHGHTWVDREGLLTEEHLDEKTDRLAARARLAPLQSGFEMFQHIVTKERLRGRAIEAMQFYQAMSLRPLVEALRLLHCPARRGFGLRYLARDLPAEVHARLIPLAFVQDLDDLAIKHQQVRTWFAETMTELTSQTD